MYLAVLVNTVTALCLFVMTMIVRPLRKQAFHVEKDVLLTDRLDGYQERYAALVKQDRTADFIYIITGVSAICTIYISYYVYFIL